MSYYLSPTWQGYEVVHEEGGRKYYLSGIRNGEFTWTMDYTYAAKYSHQTAIRKLREAVRKDKQEA